MSVLNWKFVKNAFLNSKMESKINQIFITKLQMEQMEKICSFLVANRMFWLATKLIKLFSQHDKPTSSKLLIWTWELLLSSIPSFSRFKTLKLLFCMLLKANQKYLLLILLMLNQIRLIRILTEEKWSKLKKKWINRWVWNLIRISQPN